MRVDGHLPSWLFASFLGLASLLCLTSSARAAPAACAADVSLVPERAFVGQQVLYRVRILRRADVNRVRWVQPPAFPNIRAEWLPGHAEDAQTVRHGTVYRVREDHRALFPAWAGRIVLPAFELRCTLTSGEERIVEVASVTLEAREPPASGRPEGFTGVIGPLQVQVLSESAAIELGESVRVSVLIRGASNLWDMKPPFLEAERGAALEIHRERPELDLEAGTRLYVRRYFRLDFVPRRAGILTIPSVEVPHYDVEAGTYRVARSRPIDVTVSMPAVSRADADAANGQAAADAQESREMRNDDTGTGSFGSGCALFALTAIASGVVGVGVRLRRRAPWQEVDQALADAERARKQDDPVREAAALVRALRAARALARAARIAPFRERLDELQSQLDAVRFAGQGASPPRDQTRSLINEIR